MAPLRVVILEDNISMVWEYEMILDKMNVEVVGIFKTWEDSLDTIKKLNPDFMIVDLFLADNQSGFGFAEAVTGTNIPFLICTGYPKEPYLERAEDLGASGFFSKPLDKPALTFKIKSLIKELSVEAEQGVNLVIRSGRVLHKIPQVNILWIEVDGNYSTIFTTDGRKMVMKESLKRLTPQLDARLFTRCQRSTIVNVQAIESIDMKNAEVVMPNGTTLKIGNAYKKELLEFYKQQTPTT